MKVTKTIQTAFSVVIFVSLGAIAIAGANKKCVFDWGGPGSQCQDAACGTVTCDANSVSSEKAGSRFWYCKDVNEQICDPKRLDQTCASYIGWNMPLCAMGDGEIVCAISSLTSLNCEVPN